MTARIMLTRLLMVMGLAFALDCGASGEVYKYVDEDGNTVYTDEPPSEDAEPMDLPELTVTDIVQPAPQDPDPPAAQPEQPEVDLSFTSPAPEQNLWGTGNDLAVELSAQPGGVIAGGQVVLYIDDEEVTRSRSLSAIIKQIDRGTHDVRAEMVDSNGEVVAEAGPVTFHMHQHSRRFNNN